MAIEDPDPTIEPVESPKRDRRHPIEVTIERLTEHQTVFTDHITPAEQREISQLVRIVDRILGRVTGDQS